MMMTTLLALSMNTAVAADKKPLHGGEFRNNAQTTEKGELVLHPLFMQSHYGVSDNIDVKVPLLGLLAGPLASVEVGLVDNDSIAFSIEPFFQSNWGFNSLSLGADVRFTKKINAHRFNISTGGGFSQATSTFVTETANSSSSTSVTTSSLSIPLNIGYDMSLGETKMLRFVTTTNIGGLLDGDLLGTFGVNYNTRVTEKFTISAGIAAVAGTLDVRVSDGFDQLGINNLPIVIPAPTFEMWWKI